MTDHFCFPEGGYCWVCDAEIGPTDLLICSDECMDIAMDNELPQLEHDNCPKCMVPMAPHALMDNTEEVLGYAQDLGFDNPDDVLTYVVECPNCQWQLIAVNISESN